MKYVNAFSEIFNLRERETRIQFSSISTEIVVQNTILFSLSVGFMELMATVNKTTAGYLGLTVNNRFKFLNP